MNDDRPDDHELASGALVECPTCGVPARLQPLHAGAAHRNQSITEDSLRSSALVHVARECVRDRAHEHSWNYTATIALAATELSLSPRERDGRLVVIHGLGISRGGFPAGPLEAQREAVVARGQRRPGHDQRGRLVAGGDEGGGDRDVHCDPRSWLGRRWHGRTDGRADDGRRGHACRRQQRLGELVRLRRSDGRRDESPDVMRQRERYVVYERDRLGQLSRMAVVSPPSMSRVRVTRSHVSS